MPRVNIPIPGKDKDYDSRKSRARLVNLMVETNNDGSFRSIRKREGVDTFGAAVGDGIVSNFLNINNQTAYFCGNTNGYTVSATAGVTSLGAHGQVWNVNTQVYVIQNNATPIQYLFFEESSTTSAAVWDGAVWTTVTDADYLNKNPVRGGFINSRIWLGSAGGDVFFGSDPGDALNYNPLTTGSADEVEGTILAVMADRSALWTFSDRNIEYWQTVNDPNFPLRRVQGASKRIGLQNKGIIGVATPIDQLYGYIGFVGSDNQIYLLNNNEIQKISDFDIPVRIQDDPTTSFVPKVSFVDGPDHKYLVVTSFQEFSSIIVPDLEFTWVYDLKTGQSHYRTSPSSNYWNYWYSTYLHIPGTVGSIIMREQPNPGNPPTFSGQLYKMDFNNLDDNGTDFECLLQTGSMSFETDVVIDYIEVEMETGVGNASSVDPEMDVEYSKDGGATFISWGSVKLGGSTDQSNRVRMNNFGRLVRHRDFILRLTVEEPVRVEFYGLYAEINGGF